MRKRKMQNILRNADKQIEWMKSHVWVFILLIVIITMYYCMFH